MAANSKVNVEDVSQVLKMLEEQITNTHKLCLLRRRETECCVQQCRVLLKPWPLESKLDKKDEENTESTRQFQMTQIGNPAMDNTEAESKVNEAEKEDLAALEGLLAKAQRAREIQTKLDEAAAKTNQKKTILKKPVPVTTKPHVKQPTQPTTKQSLPKTSKPAPKPATAVRRPVLQKPAVKSTYNAAYGRPPSAKSLMRTTSSRSSAKVYLDSVLNKDAKGRHSRTVSREQGRVPSTRTEREPPGKETQRTTPACEEKEPKTHSEESHHNLQLALLSERDSSISAKPLDTFASDKQSNEPSAELPASKLQADNIKPVDNKPQRVTGKPPESFGLGNLDCQSNLEARDFHVQKQEWFDPFAEGAELTLPGKYRKLKATSTKLYSELRSIAEASDKPLPFQNFVDRLESGFDIRGISTHKELQDKANGLLEEHEKLSCLTSDVVSRSYNLSEDSSWPEVYKCYRHWQVVLSKFNELQRRTQQLLEAEEQLSNRCPCGNCSAFDRDHPRDVSGFQGPLDVWDKTIRRKGCALLSSWLPHDIEEIESCKDISSQHGLVEFTYSSLKELRELVRLHHEAQLLRFQLHVKQLAGEKLLPLLEKLDPSDRSFVPLYRVIHGLLCGGGKVFPAMVLDNL